jgi:cell division protein FtsB
MSTTLLPTLSPGLGAAISRHVILAAFLFLTWQAGNFIAGPVQQGHIQLILLCLFEISIIVVTGMVVGDKSIARDINELNTYSLFAHLIYLAVYFLDIHYIYHTIAIRTLGCLAIARLLYFGPRTADGDFKGLPTFGLLGHARLWWQARTPEHTARLDAWLPNILFFGSAIPMWGIMVRTHDVLVTTVLAVLMSFIFFIAKYLQARILSLQAQVATQQRAFAAEQTALANCRAELEAQRAQLQQTQAQLTKYSGNTIEAALYAHANLLDALPATSTPQAQYMARQLVANWQATHPAMRNLQIPLTQYMACQFPDESAFGAQSITHRTAKALRELAELLFITREQIALLEADGVEALDFEFLVTSIDNAPLFDIDTMAVKAFMTSVLLIPYKKLTTRTLMMTCEMLSTTLLRILLSQCGKEYLHDFAELEDLTRQFINKHIPLACEDDE